MRIATRLCLLPRSLLLLGCLIFFWTAACRGSLSEEDKNAIREEMESREIKRISEGAIMEAAFAKGRKLRSILQQPNEQTDSLEVLYSAEIEHLSRGSDMNAKEASLWEAYQYNISKGLPLEDNVQKLGDSALLYTVPIQQADSLTGMWSIAFEKRAIVSEL